MAASIGMMDSAYFVGRSEILAWINFTLQLNLSKVEEVCALSSPKPLLDNFVSFAKRPPKSTETRKLFVFFRHVLAQYTAS